MVNTSVSEAGLPPTRSARWLAFGLALVVLGACGGGDARSAVEGDVPPGANQESAGTVAITSPLDGAEVSNPVTVSMTSSGFTIEPAGAVKADAGHFHLMVDVGCVPAGDVIPLETPGYNHYGKAQTEATLTLAPGEHKLCLQAGDGVHTALDIVDEMTVTVAG
ncbi:MAG: DUF4399 domain-containing protein [Acidimicrobiales bacterium]